MQFSTSKAFKLRTRLIRRILYRMWKSWAIRNVKSLISDVRFEEGKADAFVTPSIFITTYTRIEDYLILTYLFLDQDLTIVVPGSLPEGKLISRLRAFNRIIDIETDSFNYSFVKKLLVLIRNYHGSLVFSPKQVEQIGNGSQFNYIGLARLSMVANAPIRCVSIAWDKSLSRSKKCTVFIGKKIFVSPRNPDFKDIFFKRKGQRKLSRLNQEELLELGKLLSDKIKANQFNGPNI